MTNSILKGVITLCICIALLQTVLAVQITNVSAPSSVLEGTILTLSFAANEPVDYLILKDWVELTTTPNYNEILDYSSAGLYTFIFSATNGSHTVNVSRQIEIIDVPFTMNVEQPTQTQYATNIPLEVKTSRPANLCYVSVGTTSNTLTQVNQTSFIGSLSLIDGVHTLSIKCKLPSEITTINKTIIVDTQAPKITLTPQGNVQEYPVALTVQTDEIATCIYGAANSPDILATDNGLTHQTMLRPSGGQHTIQVTCSDVLGNNATKTTTFTLERPPSAKITVDDANPHKAGSYEITLEVSEPLQSSPSLSLTFDDGSTRSIPLEQDTSTQYTGILLIEENFGDHVGSFSFSATGISGLSGATIQEAPLFVTDTTKPVKIAVFRATNSSNNVNLSWFYDGEDDMKFNIYRTTGNEVTYTDFYTSAVGTSYQDHQIGSAVTFYYRIAAVDDAGNVGPLSEEKSASPAKVQFEEEKQEMILDPLLQLAVDTRLRELETWILDANRVAQDLRSTTDEHKSKLLVDLGILAKLQEEQATLQSVKEELLQLKKLYLSKEQLEERMSMAFEKAIAARGAMPKSLTIQNKVEYDETPSEQSLEQATQTISVDVSESRKLSDIATIKTTLSHIVVEFTDNTKNELSVIDKTLSFDQPEQSVLAAEIIPSDLIAQSEPTFIATSAQSVGDGIYQMSYDSIKSQRILYTLPGIVDVTRLRNTKLVPLRQLRELETSQTTPQDNALTGNSILPDMSGILNTNTTAVFFGLIIVGSLLFYYFKMQDDFTPTSTSTPTTTTLANYETTSTATYQIPQAKSTILIERKETPLTQLLMSGNMLIDQNKYLDALYFYKKSIEKYKSENFTPQINNALKIELQLLYSKLLLAQEMSNAHDAIMAQDFTTLETAMSKMRAHAINIGPESGIVQRAEQSYRYFYAQWNNLQTAKHDVDEQDL